jgi:hypothetical protein
VVGHTLIKSTATIRILCVTILSGTMAATQNTKDPFASVPASQRRALANGLVSYTGAFKERDWALLYDLVSDENKKGPNGNLKVNRAAFVRAMKGTDERLIEFEPIWTDPGAVGTFYIYGCGEVASGDQNIERISAVRAVRKHGKWFFANWDYTSPPEPCSHLGNPEWKPGVMSHLNEPMDQVLCAVHPCTE